ncbi:hypothetical protein SLS62_007924 [Diatrype stigma]|uniref:Uncharacterized protein n=1 Tax=Diatrype stigma TaxID=117547 RepID=A0AAN9UYJ3_9PEZI
MMPIVLSLHVGLKLKMAFDPRSQAFLEGLYGTGGARAMALGGTGAADDTPSERDLEAIFLQQLQKGRASNAAGAPDDLDLSDPDAFIRKLDPSVHFASPEEVRREAQTRSKHVFSSYTSLHEILIRHEATIQKRWAKKTRPQRQKILLDAWPGMATPHRPDFDAFRRTNRKHQPVSGERFRDQYMWPHINQDDLLKPKSLLLLVNARGRNPPPDFAGADYEAMHLGLVTKHIKPWYLNCYVMVLHGATNAEEYGKLVAWEDHPDAFDWMHTRKQCLPGEGLIILEAQERLLKFLVDVCQQILHEIPSDQLTADTYPIQPEPQLKSDAETNGFDSLAVMAAEAPYRLPAKLDMTRIESVLSARQSAAADHLWALREDPAYFAEQLNEVKEHRQEILLDMNGQEHPTLKKVHQTTFWARVCGTVVVEAYLQLEFFSELQRQAHALRLLQTKYASAISPTEELPGELMGAILKFRHYLSQAAKGPLNQLKDHLVASPPWRKYFVRQPPPDATTSKILVQSKPGVSMNDIESQVLWILRTLWEDGQDLFFIRLPLIVDELGRLLETDPRAKELISARMAGTISDLSIVSHCISQLDLYQPWARGYESALVDRDQDIKKEFAEHTITCNNIMFALHDRNLTTVAMSGNPTDKKFAYPFEKRRTKQNVEALQQAERNLDHFWANIDRIVYAKCGSLEGTVIRRVLTQPRVMQRTPDWIDPVPSAAKQPGRESVSDSSLDSLYVPLSTIYIGEQSKGGSKSTRSPAPKTKPKTRDASTTDTDTAAITADPEVNIKPTVPTIPVDGRSLKVFRVLFFNPAVTSSPGEVAWTDFVHAMTATGLFAAEKLYGSVWQFQKLAEDQRKIQFHEPHPRGKIAFTIARRMGRRLSRAFGWAGDTFVLREK